MIKLVIFKKTNSGLDDLNYIPRLLMDLFVLGGR
jgi:hypothetical protein